MELKITNETKNPLFPRTEVRAEVEKETVPAKEEVLEALATKYKVDKEAIKIMTIKGKFGLKVFEVNAHIYSSAEEKNRIEVKTKQEKEAEKKAKEDAEKAAEEERLAKEVPVEETPAETPVESTEPESKAPAEETKVEEPIKEAPVEDAPISQDGSTPEGDKKEEAKTE